MVYCLNGKHKNDFDIAWHIQKGPDHYFAVCDLICWQQRTTFKIKLELL